MALVKRILNVLISENSEYCNFCFKNIKHEKFFSFNDLIITKDCASVPFSVLMKTLFGAKYIDYCITELFCQQCTESMIRSYNFFEMCRSNTEQLLNTMSCIENNILGNNKKTDSISDNKSLFVVLDSTNWSNKQMHSKMEARKKNASSLNLLESISNNIIEDDFIETADNYHNKSIVEEPASKKRKKDNIKLQVTEMIDDTNNMSSFRCKICRRTYSNISRLKQHFVRVHAPKDYNCTDCNKKFGSLSLLKQHKNDIHRLFICTECGKSYKYRSSFIIHTQSHTLKLVCQLCGKLFKNKRCFNNHIKLNICNLSSRKKNLEKKYVCDYCNKKYSNKNTLRSHISFEHGNGTAHICAWCNKKFNAISRLTAHIVTHTQEKKFGCDVCGGRYVTKESLHNHVRIHTGERPYRCEYCDQCFLSSSRRAEHNNRYHQNPNIDCELCHSKFRSRTSLIRHKNRHFNPNSRLHYTRLAPIDKEFS